MLEPGVIQFVAVCVMMGVMILLGSLIFAHFITKAPGHVVSPVAPKGDLARSQSLISYLTKVYRINESEVLKNSGADGLLSLRRTKMRFCIVLALVPVSAVLLVIYSVNVEGGGTSKGLARTTLTNSAAMSAPALRLRLWAMVAAAYAVQIVGSFLLDRYDEDALAVVSSSISKAPGHHYAVVLRGLETSHDDDFVKETFIAALSHDVLAVHRVKAYNFGPTGTKGSSDQAAASVRRLPPFFTVRNEDDILCFFSPWATLVGHFVRRRRCRRGGLRGAMAVYLEALACARQRYEDGYHYRDEAWGRAYAEECRLRVQAALARDAPSSNAAVVVLESLSSATTASTSVVGLLGMPRTWKIDPAPEPRDIIWENLEDGNRYDRTRFACLLAIFSVAAAAFSGVAVASRSYAKSGPGRKNAFALMASGVITVMIAKFVMVQSHAILRLALFQSLHAWSRSRLELGLQRYYTRLLVFSALTAPLLVIALVAIVPESNRSMLRETYDASPSGDGDFFFTPPDFLRAFVVGKLPGLGFGFVAMLVYKAGIDAFDQLFRVDAYVHFLKMKYIALSRYGGGDRDDEDLRGQQREKTLRFDDSDDPTRTQVSTADLSGQASFEVFGLAVVCAWTPLAPAVAPIALAYFLVALGVQNVSLSNTSCTNFNVDGLFWHLDVKQTRLAFTFAIVLQILVCLSCGSVVHLIALSPLLVLAIFFDARAVKRFATRNAHGFSAGRLPLVDAAAVDAKRSPTGAPRACAEFCAADKCWSPREEPPVSAVDFYPGEPIADEDDFDDRLGPLEMWLGRYDSKRAIPTFFETEGQEDVVFKDTTVNKIRDTVWRKLKSHTYRRKRGPSLSLDQDDEEANNGGGSGSHRRDLADTALLHIGTRPGDDERKEGEATPRNSPTPAEN